jgi:hypothetical protein
MQPPEGIDRERRAGNVGVRERHVESLVSGHGQAAHLHAVGQAGLHPDRLVRRLVHRHELDTFEPDLGQRLSRAHEVGDVRRVERPAEQPHAGH